jgi:hypothetical protein
METNTFLIVFLALNIAFLVGTAVWFRVDHASSSRRFTALMQDSLMADLMWQYSLRSNLLLWGCAMSAYLLYIGEALFLLGMFAAFSVLNVVTDHFYQYPDAHIFTKAKRGHLIAGVVIWIVTIVYFAL